MRLSWIGAVLSLTTVAVAGEAETKPDAEALGRKIFEWINNAKGGYVHPDQEFRDDPESGISGIFATKFIPKGTVLCQVPWRLILKPDDEDEEGQMACGTVKALAREMKKGNESSFAPFVNYLHTMPANEVPSIWSDQGKKLFQELVGGTPLDPIIPPEEPTEWIENDWFRECRGNRADTLSVKAAVLTLQRSDDAILIPGYDMYNHRNGRYLNTEVTQFENEKHVTIARRDIEKGEQIHNSYNMCKQCSGRSVGYGTAEILRDYGFVEQYPQIWHYMNNEMQFEIEENEEGGFDLRWMPNHIPKTDDRPAASTWLQRQIRRLRQIKNVNYRNGNPGMPEYEWETAWAFQRANIQAMTVAIESLEAIEAGKADPKGKKTVKSIVKRADFEKDVSHYDELGWEYDDLEYVTPTCDNKEIMMFHDHVVVEEIKTHYQQLNFAIHPETGEVVMDLDNIVQIASNYRPQYHEYMTHAAARFIPDFTRVIFIGGGDSMLLHEILKYPDLELVVGLELDQIVVRKAFKYFRSSPHFDDPRVEWWFGDATKSLLLLPEEYWQSFDLVLVDLSETVMSLSVTKELDVFDALALLLKHEGIMVKNELYMEPISKVFDYSMDILYESPIICSQVLAFGSNKVDFMHDEAYDHGVETFLYKNMHDPDTRHNFTHDYRINNATKQGKCGELPVLEKLEEQSKSAGVLQIVEAEKVTATLDESLGSTFLDVITKEGFKPIAAPIYENGMLMIALKEGYVMARMFPAANYCNLDIHVWGSFHKLKSLQKALISALGSKDFSQFKVVVGGMYGSQTWKEDREIIGPKIIQTRNCDIPTHEDAKDVTKELITAAFDEGMKLLTASEATAILVCKDDSDCLAEELLKKYSDGAVRKMVKVSECASEGSNTFTQYDCEIKTTAGIMADLGNDKADLVVIDSKVSREMVQILNSILAIDDFRTSTMNEDKNIVMVWTMDAEKEEYQRNFLDRYRKQHEWDPQARAELWMQDGKQALEFGINVAGDKQVIYRIADLETNVKELFKGEENVKVELRGIYGGLYEFKPNWAPPEFLQSDYDTEEGFQQYFMQKPLARHTVFQLEEGTGKRYDFTKDSLNHVFAKSLEAVGFECSSKYTFTDIGEGVVILCMAPKTGSAVMVWDGRKHVDISYYLIGDMEGEPEKFIGAFMHNTDKQLSVALRDDMPRGINRVVNFESDIRSPEELEAFYEGLHDKPRGVDGGNDDDEDDDEGDEGAEL